VKSIKLQHLVASGAYISKYCSHHVDEFVHILPPFKSFNTSLPVLNTVLPASLHPDSANSWHFKTQKINISATFIGKIGRSCCLPDSHVILTQV